MYTATATTAMTTTAAAITDTRMVVKLGPVDGVGASEVLTFEVTLVDARLDDTDAEAVESCWVGLPDVEAVDVEVESSMSIFVVEPALDSKLITGVAVNTAGGSEVLKSGACDCLLDEC